MRPTKHVTNLLLLKYVKIPRHFPASARRQPQQPLGHTCILESLAAGSAAGAVLTRSRMMMQKDEVLIVAMSLGMNIISLCMNM
jgi:hypothetical protein